MPLINYRLSLVILMMSIQYFTHAQGVNFVLRGNTSNGLDAISLDYLGNNLQTSPGGGIGLEAGLQLPLMENLLLQPTLGHFLSFGFQYESINGTSNQSSMIFNRIFLSLGVIKQFKFDKPVFQGLLLGTGLQYNLPGKLKRTENNQELGYTTYDNSMAIYMEVGLRIKIAKALFLDPGIRFRRLHFNINGYSDGDIADLPGELRNLNANGLEFGLSFVWIM